MTLSCIKPARSALTLMELMAVLVILIALAGIVVPWIDGATEDAQAAVTRSNLHALQTVIMGRYRLDMDKQLPRPGSAAIAGRSAKPQLRYLFINPATELMGSTYNPDVKVGWNGPYLAASGALYKLDPARGFTTDYGLDDPNNAKKQDPTVLDGWNHPIVIVELADMSHAELRSAGADGKLGTADDLFVPLY